MMILDSGLLLRATLYIINTMRLVKGDLFNTNGAIRTVHTTYIGRDYISKANKLTN